MHLFIYRPIPSSPIFEKIPYKMKMETKKPPNFGMDITYSLSAIKIENVRT